jgi:hypothetical protein
MINQLSNNKPSGYQSINCDAGVPISGRTASNGSYQILKVSDAGALLVQSTVDATGVNYNIENSAPVTIGTGLIGAGVYLFTVSVTTVSLSAGTYTISPSVFMEGAGTGSISLILADSSSLLVGYSATLNSGIDAFAPTVVPSFVSGVACVWHNLPLNALGTGGVITATGGNANVLEKTVYLQAGNYTLIGFVDTAINITGAFSKIGLQGLMQVG